MLPPESLRIVVNTGDDFEHLGLRICPDIDTTIYTLSGLSNPELGWAPSNPYRSIDPILAVRGMRALLRGAGVPVIAVMPLIGAAAVKGPTAKIMRELGVAPSPRAIIEHYRGLIDGFELDSRDAALAARIDLPVQVCDTLMVSLEDRERVAASVLEFAARLRPGHGR